MFYFFVEMLSKKAMVSVAHVFAFCMDVSQAYEVGGGEMKVSSW